MPSSESNRFQNIIHNGYNRLKKGAPAVLLMGALGVAGCAGPGNTVKADSNEGPVATSTITPPAQETVTSERPSNPDAKFLQLDPEEYKEFANNIWNPAIDRLTDIMKNSANPEGSQGNSRSRYRYSSDKELIFYRDGAATGYGERGVISMGVMGGVESPLVSYITVTIEDPNVGSCTVAATNPDYKMTQANSPATKGMVEDFFEKSDNLKFEGVECSLPPSGNVDRGEYFVILLSEGEKVTAQSGAKFNVSPEQMRVVTGEDQIRELAEQPISFFKKPVDL